MDIQDRKKQFSKRCIYEILDRRIKEEVDKKNKYMKNNGNDSEVLSRFDVAIATIFSLYKEFDDKK